MSAGRHTARGHQLLERGDADGAMRAFLDALADDPSYVPALLSRLELLALHREDHVAAVAAGRVLRARGLGGVVMASAFAYSLQALGERAEALTVIYEGLRTAPETETLWYMAACLHAQEEQPERAAIALEVAAQLLPANAALARDDEDFAAVRAAPWFARALASKAAMCAHALRIRIAGQTSLADALTRRGHTIERRDLERVTGDAVVPMCAALLADGADRVFVVDDGSDAARWTERELAQRPDVGPPVALLTPSWLPTEHLPSFHAPDDVWGPGALGLLRFFLLEPSARPG